MISWSLFKMSRMVVPGNNRVCAPFGLTFLTIESPIMSVVGGGAVSQGDLTCGNGVDGEERAEWWVMSPLWRRCENGHEVASPAVSRVLRYVLQLILLKCLI